MRYYINNLINRLKEFSKSLDTQEVFIDKPWVVMDEKSNQLKYIFKRNGDLIMSLNGNVSIGNWEYIPQAKSLLIDRIESKILLNQSFVDPAVMVLNMDGIQEEHFVLVNEVLIPDYDVVKYLKNKFYEHNRITPVKLKNDKVLEIHNYKNSFLNLPVSIDQEDAPDGKYELEDSSIRLVVSGNSVKKVLFLNKYKTKKGELAIEITKNRGPEIGAAVYLNNRIAPDGRYWYGLLSSVKVKDGKIIKLI